MKNRMLQTRALMLMICGLSLLSFSCQSRESSAPDDRLRVIATIFPVYDFARQIGDNKIDLTMIPPPGMNAYAYELTPAEMDAICRADLFLFTSFEMEQWVFKAISAAEKSNTTAVETGSGATLLPRPPFREVFPEQIYEQLEQQPLSRPAEELPDRDSAASPVVPTDPSCSDASKPAAPSPSAPAGHYDPHIWLDLKNAQIMVDNIAEAFINKDPRNSDTYKRNARAYKRKLSRLDDAFTKQLAVCQSKVLRQSGHRTFAYLAQRYALKYHYAEGLSRPNLSQQETLNILGLEESDKPASLFCDQQLSEHKQHLLVKEMGVEVLSLDNGYDVEPAAIAAGETFLSIMERNLLQLKKGLHCP